MHAARRYYVSRHASLQPTHVAMRRAQNSQRLRGTVPMMSIGDQLRPILAATPEVVVAVLFGSHARGSASTDSDVDLALRVDAMPPEVLNALLATLERACGRTIDFVPLDSSPPLLRFEIAQDGVPLLERASHAWHDFRARAMLDWWEWAPFAERFAVAAVGRLRSEVGRGPA